MYENRSLDRAFSTIDLFNEETEKLTASQIAKRFGLTLGGIYPTLYNLTRLGYLARDAAKKYSLGLKFLERANLLLHHLDLRDKAKSPLKDLSRVYDANTRLSILYGWEVMHLHLETKHRRVISRESVGERIPAYCSGLGKVLLAYLDEDSLSDYLKAIQLVPLTSKTIIYLEELKSELANVRKKGFAFDKGEFHKDVRCIAAPVRSYQGEVIAAVSISMPRSKFAKQAVSKVIEDVKNRASCISRSMGFHVSYSEVAQ